MRSRGLRTDAGVTRRLQCAALLGVVLVAISFVQSSAAAEPASQKAQEASPAAAAPQGGSQKADKPPSPGVPPLKNLLIMIRTTLVALYQANITNNYSVLRDLGAPSFQQANNVERLSAAFADLRSRGGDMAPVVLALPTLSQPAAIDQNGMLRLTGAFDTRPNELAFDLVFQVVGGFWRLDGIAVQFRPPALTKASESSAAKASQASDTSTASKSQKKTGKGSKSSPR